MNKPFFFFLIAISLLVFNSCEPAKQGGGESAPSNFNEGITVEPSKDQNQPASQEKAEDSTETKKEPS